MPPIHAQKKRRGLAFLERRGLVALEEARPAFLGGARVWRREKKRPSYTQLREEGRLQTPPGGTQAERISLSQREILERT